MKKYLKFAIFILSIFAFSTCDLQIPNAVEIDGSLSLRLSARYDVGSLFEDNLKDMLLSFSNNGMTYIKCTNTAHHTYLFYQEVLEKDFSLTDSTMEFPEGVPPEFAELLKEMGEDYDEPDFEHIVQNGEGLLYDDNITIPLTEIGADSEAMNMLEGFIIKDAKILLFISGSGGLAELLEIDLKINGEEESVDINDTQPSGLSIDTNYTNPAAPSHYAVVIDITDLELDSDIVINYKIYIPDGTPITRNDLDKTGSIKVEAVVWLPLELVAGAGGASFEIPDLFPEGDDLFGRKEPSSDNILLEMIKSLSLSIVMSNNPFDKAALNVSSKGNNGSEGIAIQSTISGDLLSFHIDDNVLGKINDPDNFPFNPVISLNFDEGGSISMPRDFNFGIKQLAASATVNYRHEL